MNTYRIEVDFVDTNVTVDGQPTGGTANFETQATDRESALYNMFDELTDHGYQVERLGSVYLIVEGVATLILPHRQVAPV